MPSLTFGRMLSLQRVVTGGDDRTGLAFRLADLTLGAISCPHFTCKVLEMEFKSTTIVLLYWFFPEDGTTGRQQTQHQIRLVAV
jgi:hypothetical protein